VSQLRKWPQFYITFNLAKKIAKVTYKFTVFLFPTTTTSRWYTQYTVCRAQNFTSKTTAHDSWRVHMIIKLLQAPQDTHVCVQNKNCH